MQEAARLPNEAHRLHLLHRYHILDTAQEDVFDELADLAASVCEVPIALISLVDDSRQWFKAHIGLEARETARSVSFCAHAILQPGVFIVNDTHADSRFSDNPLVTGPPHIRFYAGAPLFTDSGFGLGTLCVIDHVPRTLSLKQQKALSVLRTHILKLLELRLRTRELAELNRELETYSYTVSHDLRSPLRAIDAYSTILMQDHAAALGSAGKQLVENIRDAGQRMQQITDDLLYLSDIGRVPLHPARTDLGALATRVVSDLRRADPQRKVDVLIAPDMQVNGDPGLLRTVLENLLGNAWKYTSKCEQARIEFGVDSARGRKAFYVRDNGIGFEMAYAGRIFEPFERLHTATGYEGSGIGLATVKRIIERHGGTIRVESTVGNGATFHFTLQADFALEANGAEPAKPA